MAQPVTVRPSAAPRPRGPVVYPSEDGAAESLLHFELRTLLRAITNAWLAGRGQPALTLSNQFVYWVEGDPGYNVVPDLLVIPGEAPTRSVTSWKTWEEDHEPTFAMAIRDVDEAVLDTSPSYDALGVHELVVYDPVLSAEEAGPRWRIYRREGGAWSKVVESNAASVESRELGCWLCEVIVGGQQRVRLATDPDGRQLVRTPEEAANEAAAAYRQRTRELEEEIERMRAKLRGE